jgi:hypothetical protein
MRIPHDVAVRQVGSVDALADRPIGHAHFWERAMESTFSRGQFLRRGAVAAGGLAGLSVVVPGLAHAAGSDPRPIPGGIQPFGPETETFHVSLPGPDNEPATITDYNGFTGIAAIRGHGADDTGGTLYFDVDMRFMKGLYTGQDGRLRQGAFAFV